jgi:hypothetical protein
MAKNEINIIVRSKRERKLKRKRRIRKKLIDKILIKQRSEKTMKTL